MSDEQPKKISPDQVEVLSAQGEVVKEASDRSATAGTNSPFGQTFGRGFGQMKVIQGGPWLLLLLPVLIPVVLIGLFILMVCALIFGRGMFKMVKGQIRPRG